MWVAIELKGRYDRSMTPVRILIKFNLILRQFTSGGEREEVTNYR
jgi:hypothetical protein